MRWDLHELIIEGITNNASLEASWHASFASRPISSADPHLHCRLDVVSAVPPAPPGEPHFRQGDLLHYYVNNDDVVAHFPRFGQLHLNLAEGTTIGHIVSAALDTYGVLEDLIAISLSPHLRRRGLFLVHAFAAALNGRAVLLVGGIGAGKTTTGMSLLNAGWHLLSNDSPILAQNGIVLSYPGLLAAYPETFGRFVATNHLTKEASAQNGRQKITVAAEQIWPQTWLDQAPIGAICFPQIEQRPHHDLEPLTPSAALTRLLPHAVEQWDKAMIPQHLKILRQLVEAAPAYLLRLGPDVLGISAVLQEALSSGHPHSS